MSDPDRPDRAITLDDANSVAPPEQVPSPEPVAVEPVPAPDVQTEPEAAPVPPPPVSGSPSTSTQLVRLVTDGGAELWHDQATRESYISWATNGHREHHRLTARAVRAFIARLGHQHLGRAPGGSAIADALVVLDGIARFDGDGHDVGLRVAQHGDGLVLDLADEAWRAVVVRPTGWEVVDDPPVRFRRPRGMLPLPAPEYGSSLDPLRSLLGIDSERTWVQIVGWLVGTLAPDGPYPVLALLGEQGSGKSTVARLLRSLVDPHAVGLRGPVRDERDLMIAASHSHIVGFDNLSKIPDWLSDGLCRISTGGGFATRQLFTDDDELLIDVMRPIVITAISAVVQRGDLLDRSMVETLPTLASERRRKSTELVAQYNDLRPRLLGALLDVVQSALDPANHSDIALPRMADHVEWVSAAEEALGWPDGSYAAAYTSQQQEAVEVQLDGDPVAQTLRELMFRRLEWKGTATQLLEVLGTFRGSATPDSAWPRSAKGLSQKLDRLAPDLRRTGLDVSRYHDGTNRVICVRTVSPHDGAQDPSVAVAPRPAAPTHSALVPQPDFEFHPEEAFGACDVEDSDGVF